MSPDATHRCSAFAGSRRIACGRLDDVAVAAAQAASRSDAAVLVFSDITGDAIDLDLRGTADEVRARHAPIIQPPSEAPPRGRGRPRLGVVAREVTLLPEHWEWLASQPGGASVALRKLVQAARRAGTSRDRLRRAQERSYKAMVTLAGDRPKFEEAARALFAADLPRLLGQIERWPRDIREYILQLADPEFDAHLGTAQ